MNAKHVRSHGHGEPASPAEDEGPTAGAAGIADFGTVLVDRDHDDLVGRAFAVCDDNSEAQPMGVIVGRIVEPSCCIFQRIDGSMGMVPTAAFTCRSPQVGREPGQAVLYRNVDEMRFLLMPPPPAAPAAEAGGGGQ